MLCLLSVSARPSGPQRKTPILELLRKWKYGQKLGMEQLDILHVNIFYVLYMQGFSQLQELE